MAGVRPTRRARNSKTPLLDPESDFYNPARFILRVKKFLDAGIQDVSTSISIEFKIEHLDELIEMSVDDESDTHVEARDLRYLSLIISSCN